MRRKERKMTEEFALTVADKCEWAVLSMVTPENEAYGVPLSIARDGQYIYFHCAADGRKINCLRQNTVVHLSCVGDTHRMENIFSTEYESAFIKGVAEEVTSDEEKIHALRLICMRHTPLNMAQFDAAIKGSLHRTHIWKIEIKEITGKRLKYRDMQN